jgi:hypothetical protein
MVYRIRELLSHYGHVNSGGYKLPLLGRGFITSDPLVHKLDATYAGEVIAEINTILCLGVFKGSEVLH